MADDSGSNRTGDANTSYLLHRKTIRRAAFPNHWIFPTGAGSNARQHLRRGHGRGCPAGGVVVPQPPTAPSPTGPRDRRSVSRLAGTCTAHRRPIHTGASSRNRVGVRARYRLSSSRRCNDERFDVTARPLRSPPSARRLRPAMWQGYSAVRGGNPRGRRSSWSRCPAGRRCRFSGSFMHHGVGVRSARCVAHRLGGGRSDL